MQTLASMVATAQGAMPLTLHKITDVGYCTLLKNVLRDLSMDDHKALRFPGPNPVSLDTTHFSRLAAEPYYVCEKTDGVRFIMLCCAADMHDRRANLCVIVDRALTMYLLPIQHWPRAVYQGTLLDGELAWNRQRRRWEYLVFDAVCVSGIPVLNGTLVDRMAAVHRIVRVYAEASRGAPPDAVDIGVKNFVSCSKLAEFEAALPQLRARYDIDGMILTPALAPVSYGRHLGMFKLKSGSRHTVDFLVGADGRQLSVFDNGAHVTVGALFPGDPAAPPGSIAECALASPNTTLWTVVTLRTDKSTANDMYTYQKTMLNMREGLTIDSIKRLFKKSV